MVVGKHQKIIPHRLAHIGRASTSSALVANPKYCSTTTEFHLADKNCNR